MSVPVMSLQTVGNWSDKIQVPLANALGAATEICGWSGYKACEKAIVYMAKSAGKLTKVAPKLRKVVENPFLIGSDGKRKKRVESAAKWGFYTYGSNGEKKFNPIFGVNYAPYYVTFKSATTGQMLVKDLRSGKVHRLRSNVKGGIETSKSNASKDKRLIIKRSGNARDSWMWGIKGFQQKAIPNVTDVKPFVSSDLCGLVLTDRIRYILKITPANLVDEVSRRATDSIMFTAAQALERKLGVEVPRLAAGRAAKAEKKLQQEFSKAEKAGSI